MKNSNQANEKKGNLAKKKASRDRMLINLRKEISKGWNCRTSNRLVTDILNGHDRSCWHVVIIYIPNFTIPSPPATQILPFVANFIA
jgi:hypothetical protein